MKKSEENSQATYQPADSFVRVATACPEVSVADVGTNVARISELYTAASKQNAALVVFPELSITGYTLGDLVQHKRLLDQAMSGLQMLAETTQDQRAAMIVGLPIRIHGGLYNTAATLADGEIKGIVPKSHLPTYNEFYERRWYETWNEPDTTLKIGDAEVPFGTDLLFDIAGTTVGVEICEDAWVANPPSTRQALRGAQIIANPSASPEQIGKAQYRRDMVRMHSGQLIAGYLYAGCHTTESTAEVVMGGHQIIAADGALLAERRPFGSDNLLLADIDIDHLDHDRRKQHMAQEVGAELISTKIVRRQKNLLRAPEPSPFHPRHEPDDSMTDRLDAALNIQAYGLAMRMQASQQNRVILGLSGGPRFHPRAVSSS